MVGDLLTDGSRELPRHAVRPREVMADVLVSLALLALVAAGIYQIFIPVWRLVESQPLR